LQECDFFYVFLVRYVYEYNYCQGSRWLAMS
jgi:hypothetical protein